MEKKTWCGWRKQKKNGSFFVGLVFLSFFFVSPSVFHLPLQRVRVLQGRQANNGDQETTNSVDSTQKKKNKDKNVRTDGEGWWWWWFVLRRRRQGKQKKGKTVGSGGCGGQLSGRVWSAYWFFFKKMDDEREIVWRRNERGGSKFLPAIRGSAVGVRRRHVETNELRVWICFFA